MGLIIKSIGLFLSVSAFATSGEFDFGHPDEVLKETFVFSENIEVIEFEALPKVVQKTMGDIEIAYELGDGYYDSLKEVYYQVLDESGNVVGYMKAGIYSYTEEDDEFPLAVVRVNLQGRRLDMEPDWQPMSQADFKDLPPELVPDPADLEE